MKKTPNATRSGFRKRLLATASAAALCAAICSTQAALAGEESPPLWIELGWRFEKLAGQDELFTPPFAAGNPWAPLGFKSPVELQNMQLFSYGADGAISFRPENSDWIFSASVRYGRAHGRKHAHQQTPVEVVNFTLGSNVLPYHVHNVKFTDTSASKSETHAIADFSAGRDFGLGMFGKDGISTINFGVRFAQIKTTANGVLHSDPDSVFPSDLKHFVKYSRHHHTYAADFQAARNFRGMGPAISWNASAPVTGNLEDGEVTFDWGLNAALLFGRQKVKAHHETRGAYFKTTPFADPKYTGTHYHTSKSSARTRAVTVPNFGGFAGLSFRYSGAKLSLGYRADFFFGVLDGGIDNRKNETIGFHGPFASVSFGIGD